MSTESIHEWDAAYVLGALSPDDRRAFEEHLEECPECRASVADLAGMPALLARVPAHALTTDDVARDPAAEPERAALAGVEAPRTLSGDTLATLARRVHRRRRVRRWAAASTAVLAAAAIAAAVVVPMRLDAPPAPTAPTAAVTLAPAAPSPLTATVDLTSQRWGTSITMTCRYHDAATGYTAGGRYALYVTDAAGTATRVASWSAWPGATIRASGAIDTPVSQVRTVQVRDVESGAVLLSSPVK